AGSAAHAGVRQADDEEDERREDEDEDRPPAGMEEPRARGGDRAPDAHGRGSSNNNASRAAGGISGPLSFAPAADAADASAAGRSGPPPAATNARLSSRRMTASCVPSNTMRPFCSTTMRSAQAVASRTE